MDVWVNGIVVYVMGMKVMEGPPEGMKRYELKEGWLWWEIRLGWRMNEAC